MCAWDPPTFHEQALLLPTSPDACAAPRRDTCQHRRTLLTP
uniref:Uncharacterized protein n=1 Tax=Arundo donax TaxID=35708 RepID=A0A0A9EMG1_ARUDO